MKTAHIPRWSIPILYLCAMVVAEAFIAIGEPELGVGIHILLIVLLLFHASLIRVEEPTLGALLVAMSLPPLDRVLNLGVPRFDLPVLAWLGLVSVPLVVAIGAVAYVEGFRFKDLALGFPTWRDFPLQLGIAATGIPLGLVEYAILRPDDWMPGPFVLPAFLGGVFVLFLATGVSEEIIFRRILLSRATDQFGNVAGLLFMSVAFAMMHLFYNSPLDLAFVFAVGLFYGLLVLRTKSLWGVILSHTFDNVVLYLVAPFIFLPGLHL